MREQYIDVLTTIGQEINIGGVACVPLKLTHEMVANAGFYDLGFQQGNSTWGEGAVFEGSIFAEYDFTTPNGKYFYNKFLKYGCSVEHDLTHHTPTDSSYTKWIYCFFMPSAAVDFATYDNQTYRDGVKNNFVGPNNTRLQELAKWALLNDRAIYNDLRADSPIYISITWLYQETTNTYVPTIVIEFVAKGASTAPLATDADKSNMTGNVSFIKFDKSDRIFGNSDFDMKDPSSGYIFHQTLNVLLEDEETAEDIVIEDLEIIDRDEGEHVLSNIAAKDYNGKYTVPMGAFDWVVRTQWYNCHCTYWGKNGMPVTRNPNFVKYMDPNVYSYTQPVWKFPEVGGEEANTWFRDWTNNKDKDHGLVKIFGAQSMNSWFNANKSLPFVCHTDAQDYSETYYPYNYTDLMGKTDELNNLVGEFNKSHWMGQFALNTPEYGLIDNTQPITPTNTANNVGKGNIKQSWIAAHGYLSVSAGWFTPKSGMYAYWPNCTFGKAKSDNPATLFIYTRLPNGQGHNPYNGDTLGFEVSWPYYTTNGVPEIDMPWVNSATHSAICFTNVLNFGGEQTKVDAYTEGDDMESIIINGVTPTLKMSIKGQNIGRMNLETNTIMTRW